MLTKRISILFSAVALCSSITWGDWPQFRGPNNDGHALAQDGSRERGIPTEFGENQNVKWKIPIHDRGWSTPVILGKQIWLTTATPDGQDLYVLCIDRNSGKILFDHRLFHIESPRPLGNDVNSYATPSPAIEAGRVYIHFGSYGTACIDTRSFKTLWERQDIPCNHFRGPASSPVLFEDKLILTFDGADLQYQIALDKNTGKTRWKTDRNSNFKDLDDEGKPKRDGDLRKAFSTPFITTIDGSPQMLISGSYDLFGYDPRNGKELWRIDHNGYSNASMAPYGHGLIYIITGRSQPELLAIRLSSQGDIMKPNVQWKLDKGIPSMVSPILVDDLLYISNNGGVISCVEAKTGELVWKKRLKGQYYASPIYVDGKLYFCNVTGDITVLKPGRTFDVMKINKLDDGFMASPAVSGRELYLRTKSHLYRIEQG